MRRFFYCWASSFFRTQHFFLFSSLCSSLVTALSLPHSLPLSLLHLLHCCHYYCCIVASLTHSFIHSLSRLLSVERGENRGWDCDTLTRLTSSNNKWFVLESILMSYFRDNSALLYSLGFLSGMVRDDESYITVPDVVLWCV